MNRTVFFDRVRSSFGRLNQGQVDGFNAILAGWDKRGGGDPRWLAYMLATAWHETAATMQPIQEYGSTSYLKGKPYYPYFGRGYVQLTWLDNYRKMGRKLGLGDELVNNPDKALDPVIAEEIMFVGMRDGDFCGRSDGSRIKLPDYFSVSKDDPVNARRIINGTDRAETIAGYHRSFLAAINAAVAADQPEPDPVPPPEPPPLVPTVDETVWIRRADVAAALRAMADDIEGLTP